MRGSQRTFLWIALLGVTVAGPAFGQTSSPSPSSAGPGPSGAPATATTTYPSCEGRKPTQADTDAAHGAYMAGKGSFDEADYTTALNYFKDAYRRDCTKHELLVIIARAYELKGERGEAIRALETYLERVPNASDAEVQKRRITNLRAQIAAMPPAPVTTAPPVTPAPPAASPPGSSGSPASSIGAGATGAAGGAVSAGSSSPAEEPPRLARSHTLAPWIVAGAGAAALVTGAVFFAVGRSDVADAEKVCPDHATCDNADARNKGNSGRSLETLGVIVGGVGVAAVAGGLIWHFVQPTSHPAASASASVRPDLTPGYAGLRLVGSF